MTNKLIQKIVRPIAFTGALIASVANFNGCTNIEIQGICRQQALYCGAVVGEKYPVRVAIGEWNNENHVQTQALRNDSWEYLKQRGISVVETHKPEGFKVMGYMSLERYTQTLFKNQVNHDIPEAILISP